MSTRARGQPPSQPQRQLNPGRALGQRRRLMGYGLEQFRSGPRWRTPFWLAKTIDPGRTIFAPIFLHPPVPFIVGGNIPADSQPGAIKHVEERTEHRRSREAREAPAVNPPDAVQPPQAFVPVREERLGGNPARHETPSFAGGARSNGAALKVRRCSVRHQHRLGSWFSIQPDSGRDYGRL